MTRRCPIENPHYCVGTRCQLFGVCDFNRQLDAREQHDGWAKGVQGPSETLNPLHIRPMPPADRGGEAQRQISPEAMAWADQEIGAVEEYKKANPDWESHLKPARDLITPAQAPSREAHSCPCGAGEEPCPGPDGKPLCAHSSTADTKESVQAEIDYFEKHADRFAEAHKGIAVSVVTSQDRGTS